MAFNPLIALQGKPANITGAFNNALVNIQSMDNIKRQRELAEIERRTQPLRDRVMQSQAATADREGQLAKINLLADSAELVLPKLQANDIEGARRDLVQLQSIPGLPAMDDALHLLDTNPGLLAQRAQQAIEVRNRLRVGQTSQAANKVFAPVTDPVTGQVSFPTIDPNTLQAKAVEVPGLIGLTPQQKLAAELQRARGKADIGIDEAIRKEEGKAGVQLKTVGPIAGTKKASEQAIEKSGQAFDRVEKIKTNIANYNEGIRLIDEGAGTGPITSLFPSFKAASVQLDNLQGRLGLDVVGNTTFGALSESELAFALKTALPINLQGEDLKQWMIEKRDSQQKLANYISEFAQFLGTPGNTAKDWIELQSVKQIKQEKQQSPQVIRFDAQGNMIQ